MKNNCLKFIIYFFMLNLSTQLNAQSNESYSNKAKALVAQMTLEEKALLLSGETFYQTYKIDRLNIPSIFMTDGPHGLRKVTGSGLLGGSIKSTCFPTASCLAATWNVDLAKQMGIALAEECQANDVQVILGPGINMKRSPLGGRNFEYFSEDPILAGKLAIEYIKGVQSMGIGTSLKHFAVNSQEYERMTNDSRIDERTMHEIYFPAFEMAVKEAQPATVMCSYNRINGIYGSEHPLLLEDILRKKWGFQGFVVSDWGAVDNRVAGVNAGLNLEMPASGAVNRNKIIAAVQNGQIKMERLDEMVRQYLAIVLKLHDSKKPQFKFDVAAHQALARKIASEGAVLLKNEQGILPINTQKTKKIAIIGAFAKVPRYQGAGSSQVTPFQVSNAFDELQANLGKNITLTYASAYNDEGITTPESIAVATQIAKNADMAIVFAGLPDSYESEGFDRKNLDMPIGHNQLIEAVGKVQANSVVVLMNGAAVTMPWLGKVKGVLEGWLGGQAGGGAIADVLTGKINPSGKLSETFPLRLEDTPTLEFPGLNGFATYNEGIFIGYRHYDKRKIQTLFPFGYGLSYTTFAYSNMELSTKNIKDTDNLTISLRVKNTGKMAGQEVIQLYVQELNPSVIRPEKELKGFSKVLLQAGEEKTVQFVLSKRDFAFYDTNTHDWKVNTGKFGIHAGGSSQSLPLQQSVEIESTSTNYPKLTEYSMLKDFQNHPKGKFIYPQLLQSLSGASATDSKSEPTPEEAAARKKAQAMMAAFLSELPVKKLIGFSQGKFTEEMLQAILKQVE